MNYFLTRILSGMKKLLPPSKLKKRGRRYWEPVGHVDWRRPALHIAREQGVAVMTVISYMRRNGIPVRPAGVVRGQRLNVQHKVEPSSLDWSQRDTELSKRHGVTREYIRQLRKKAGLPPSGSKRWKASRKGGGL